MPVDRGSMDYLVGVIEGCKATEEMLLGTIEAPSAASGDLLPDPDSRSASSGSRSQVTDVADGISEVAEKFDDEDATTRREQIAYWVQQGMLIVLEQLVEEYNASPDLASKFRARAERVEAANFRRVTT